MKTDSNTKKNTSKDKDIKRPRPIASVMKATLYNKTGKEAGTLDLPKEIFEVKWNADLVHQVSVAMDANARATVAHTKDRSDVRGGGKKPWRQKGTGRARHGSNRSPIWKGGGITFGPTSGKDFSKKTTKKMRNKALFSLLSRKVKEGKVLFVESIDFDSYSTKTAKSIVESLSKVEGFDGLETKYRNAAIISFGTKSPMVEKSFRNISNVTVGESRNLNVRDLLKYKYLVVVDAPATIAFLQSKIAKENPNPADGQAPNPADGQAKDVKPKDKEQINK